MAISPLHDFCCGAPPSSAARNAALMLGETYDPLSIQQLGAIGVVPDVEQARQWYEKAAALGSVAASQQLKNSALWSVSTRPREDLCLENRCCAGSDTQASSSPAPLAKKSNDDQPRSAASGPSSLRPYFARFPPAFGPVPRPTISAEGGVVRP